jgi:hypothetical protein
MDSTGSQATGGPRIARLIKTAREIADAALEEYQRVWALAPPNYIRMPQSLTAENGAKALLSSEFSEFYQTPCTCMIDGNEPGDDCDGECDEGYITAHVVVGWDTIKKIYAKAVEHLSKGPPVGQG